MPEISAAEVKKLRDATGAGMMDCKRALQEANGDFEEAKKSLRAKGLADASKRAGKEAKEGLVHAYLHAPTPGVPPKIGVLLELNTETDFTAKTDDVRALANELVLHIAAARPIYVSTEDVPDSVIEAERDVMREKLKDKPPQALEKALESVVKSYAKQFVLLDQEWVKDTNVPIRNLIAQYASRTGENIGVRRFVRWELAEALS